MNKTVTTGAIHILSFFRPYPGPGRHGGRERQEGRQGRSAHLRQYSVRARGRTEGKEGRGELRKGKEKWDRGQGKKRKEVMERRR